MEKSISDKVTDLVSQGETGKALNLLRDHVTTMSPRNEALYHSVVMLLGKYNKFEREQRLGLAPEAKNLNRIEYNLLRINEDLRTGELNVKGKRIATKRKVSSTPSPQSKSSGSSPLLWIFATLGGLVVLIFLITIMNYEEPDDHHNYDDSYLELTENPIEPAPVIETPPVSVNPTKELTGISDQVIRNLLAGSRWLDTTNGNGYINFDALGKSATYLGGAGRIQVEMLGGDGYIYAVFWHPDGTSAYLAIPPQMNGNSLSVFVQNPLTNLFLPQPMLWTKQ